VKIIQNYLSNRSITFTYNNTHYTKILTKGCPQGSPLSPLLWNILLNTLLDTFDISNALIFAFADDLTVVCKGSTLADLHISIQNSLQLISSWCLSNQLTINTSKTFITHFHKHTLPSNIILNGQVIQISKNIKILGLTLEYHPHKNKINFSAHINNTIS